jgi:hypothetical protein
MELGIISRLSPALRGRLQARSRNARIAAAWTLSLKGCRVQFVCEGVLGPYRILGLQAAKPCSTVRKLAG